jgi:signal transduction histidine kinase
MTRKPKKLPEIFSRAAEYIKENSGIGYSLFLLLLVPTAFFANNYIINRNYEKAIDVITQREAVLAENIFGKFAGRDELRGEVLQPMIAEIMRENPGIVSLAVSRPAENPGDFEILASADSEDIGQIEKESAQNFLAWSRTEGVALLDQKNGGRFWRITKSIFNSANQKTGLVSMSLSLIDSDEIVNEVITYSYWVLVITVLILVLLLANQFRLIEYAIVANRLKEIDKMKDMFISMASHELRAPLTAIKGYLDLLENKIANVDEEGRRYLGNIAASSDRLARLVEDMLEVSRLEGNRFPLEISQFNPYLLIKESVEEMRSQAMEKNLELAYEASSESVEIFADAARVKQVVVNLIGNALKYTQKGSIKITASPKNGEFMVTVADTGIGISAEEQANLFQKFYRVKNEETKNITGTGLGLWITAETVKRMKGRITLESIPGVGSHFTIHLPLAKK